MNAREARRAHLAISRSAAALRSWAASSSWAVLARSRPAPCFLRFRCSCIECPELVSVPACDCGQYRRRTDDGPLLQGGRVAIKDKDRLDAIEEELHDAPEGSHCKPRQALVSIVAISRDEPKVATQLM